MFHAKMGMIKDKNGRDLTEAGEIKKRWQDYTEELYKKDLNIPDNHDGVVADLEPDILEYSQGSRQLTSPPPSYPHNNNPVRAAEFRGKTQACVSSKDPGHCWKDGDHMPSIGVLFAYAANQHLTNQVRGAKKLISSNFKDLKIFLNDTPAQIDYLVSQYNTTKKKALSDLDNVGPLLGHRVQEQLGKEVRPALDAALTMAGVKVERAIKAIRETKEALENVSVSVEVLQEGTERLHANLTEVKRHLINTLNDSACTAAQAASTCNVIRNSLHQLNINANFSRGYAAFNDTPDLVLNQTRNILSDIKNVLEAVGSNITAFTKMLPIQKVLSDFTIYLTQSETYVQDYFPLVEQYDFYSGVGFSFLFSWVLMLTVVVTFITGGNVEKLICEPYEDKNLFKVLDTPYLLNKHWKHYLSGIVLKNPNIDLTFEKVYSDCKENKGIYTTLHLENLFNIHEILNVSMYAEDVSLKIKHINIDLSSIVLLDEIGKENLINFSSSGINEINFAAYLSEINKSVTKVDLLSFANDLEARAEQLERDIEPTSAVTAYRLLGRLGKTEKIGCARCYGTMVTILVTMKQVSADSVFFVAPGSSKSAPSRHPKGTDGKRSSHSPPSKLKEKRKHVGSKEVTKPKCPKKDRPDKTKHWHKKHTKPPALQPSQYQVPLPYGDFDPKHFDQPYLWDFYPPYSYYPQPPMRCHQSTPQSVSRDTPTSAAVLTRPPTSPEGSSSSPSYESDSDLEESQQISTSPNTIITTQGPGSPGDSQGPIRYTAASPALLEEVTELFHKGAIRKLNHSDGLHGYYSRYFTNDHSPEHTSVAQERGLVCIPDLKEAYFRISIHPAHRRLLWFIGGTEAYEYNVLPFGFATAPRVFMKCMALVAGYPYLPSGCRVSTPTLTWMIGSSSPPLEVINYIGAHLDALHTGTFLPPDRQERLITSVRRITTQWTPKGALENALKGHANNIRMIHSQQVVPLEQAMGKVKNVISAVDAAQLLINNNASLVIVQETKKYMDTILAYFEQYAEWVKESITMEVATCKPIANVIDTAVDIFLCSYVTDSLNAFWFGLGGCSVFLIPAIICAVKLAKFYRRMDTEDVYDDVETMPMKKTLRHYRSQSHLGTGCTHSAASADISYIRLMIRGNLLACLCNRKFAEISRNRDPGKTISQNHRTLFRKMQTDLYKQRSGSFMAGLGQNPRPKKRSNNEEINFQTRVKDACTMTVNGNGEMKLRIECRNQGKTYWCEYTGKPSVCHSFNNNPRIFWNQIAMELRKRINACHPNLVLKPPMCQKASPEAHMKQVAFSIKPNPRPIQQADIGNQAKMVQKQLPSSKQIKESQAGKGFLKKSGKPKPSSLPAIKPTQQGPGSEIDSEAMKLAREH
ncbi:Prominin-1-A [Varanus komodoensis]|nr:Prominin-1-A [Varanus komodoensis]